tara:strand:- start:4871 stop:7963 length:3093 start_codon:yes stop_codon:yes gene_type:complete
MSIELKCFESEFSDNIIHLKMSYNSSVDIAGIQFTLNFPTNLIESVSYSSDNNYPNFTSKCNSDAGSGSDYIKTIFFSETSGNTLPQTNGSDVVFSEVVLNLRSDVSLPRSINLTFSETICGDIIATEVPSSGINKLVDGLRPYNIADIAYTNNSNQNKDGYDTTNSDDLYDLCEIFTGFICTDFIIAGGGPSGIMTAYTISQYNPNARIILLEKHDLTFEDYKASYENVYTYPVVQNSNEYAHLFSSQPDDEGNTKKVWCGRGLGGGTNHFGLQYIDDEDLINACGYETWLNYPIIGNIREKLNDILQPHQYEDTFQSLGSSYGPHRRLELYNVSKRINKIYSESEPTPSSNTLRLLPGKLINENPNIKIVYSTSVNKVNFSTGQGSEVVSLEDFNSKMYVANKNYILCAGAIQTPVILQRSGIDCGNKIYDHAAFNLVYGKYSINQETVGQTPSIGDAVNETFVLNTTSLKAINDAADDVCLLKINNKAGIWSLYYWATGPTQGAVTSPWTSSNKHPGGASYILSYKTSSNQTMNFPHGSNYWNHAVNNDYIRTVGNDGDTVNWSDVRTVLLNSGASIASLSNGGPIYDALFSPTGGTLETTLIPQTLYNRNEDVISCQQGLDDTDYKWQTYLTLNYPTLEENIIVTFAQSKNLTGNGSVKKNGDGDTDPIVILNHIEDVGGNTTNYTDDLYNAFEYTHNIMTNDTTTTYMGYKLVNTLNYQDSEVLNQTFNLPKETLVNYVFPTLGIDSIYHYHGTCAVGEVVDTNQKVIGKNNLYIGDVSVLDKPWGGSTSFPALVTGYICGSNFMRDNIRVEFYDYETNTASDIPNFDGNTNSIDIVIYNPTDLPVYGFSGYGPYENDFFLYCKLRIPGSSLYDAIPGEPFSDGLEIDIPDGYFEFYPDEPVPNKPSYNIYSLDSLGVLQNGISSSSPELLDFDSDYFYSASRYFLIHTACLNTGNKRVYLRIDLTKGIQNNILNNDTILAINIDNDNDNNATNPGDINNELLITLSNIEPEPEPEPEPEAVIDS